MVGVMPNKLYVIHGSHPCATVEKALALKGIPYKTVELIPPMHVPLQRLRFGVRTVPGMRFEDGTKLSGSLAIVKRLEEMVPEPRLYPADDEQRARVLGAEEWGHDVLQPLARRVLWWSLAHHTRAMPSYQEGAKLPALPAPVVRALAPFITRVEFRLNDVTEDAVQADLASLPGHLDRIDGWIAEGVMGGERPNAADLQIAPSIALLRTIGDLQSLIDGRPGAELTLRLFGQAPGSIPPGVIPAQWTAAAPAAA